VANGIASAMQLSTLTKTTKFCLLCLSILSLHDEWYSNIGTELNKATAITSIVGKVNNSVLVDYDHVERFIDYTSREGWNDYLKNHIISLWKHAMSLKEFFEN